MIRKIRFDCCPQPVFPFFFLQKRGTVTHISGMKLLLSFAICLIAATGCAPGSPPVTVAAPSGTIPNPAGAVPTAALTDTERAIATAVDARSARSEEHTSELQSPCNLVCRLLLENKKTI